MRGCCETEIRTMKTKGKPHSPVAEGLSTVAAVRAPEYEDFQAVLDFINRNVEPLLRKTGKSHENLAGYGAKCFVSPWASKLLDTVPDFPPMFDKILRDVATSGCSKMPWPVLKLVLCCKIEKVLSELMKEETRFSPPSASPCLLTLKSCLRETWELPLAPFSIQRGAELLLETPKPWKDYATKFVLSLIRVFSSVTKPLLHEITAAVELSFYSTETERMLAFSDSLYFCTGSYETTDSGPTKNGDAEGTACEDKRLLLASSDHPPTAKPENLSEALSEYETRRNVKRRYSDVDKSLAYEFLREIQDDHDLEDTYLLDSLPGNKKAKQAGSGPVPPGVAESKTEAVRESFCNLSPGSSAGLDILQGAYFGEADEDAEANDRTKDKGSMSSTESAAIALLSRPVYPSKGPTTALRKKGMGLLAGYDASPAHISESLVQRVKVALRADFRSLFSASEIKLLEIVANGCLGRSESYVFSRMLNRGKRPYFSLEELETRYGTDGSGDLGQTLNNLCSLRLVATVSGEAAPASTGVPGFEISGVPETMLEQLLNPLWCLLSLSQETMEAILVDCNHLLRAKFRADKAGRKFVKRNFIQDIMRYYSLPSWYEKSVLSNSVFESAMARLKRIASIPWNVRNLFQLVDAVCYAFLPVKDAVEDVGNFSLSPSSLILQCKALVRNESLEKFSYLCPSTVHLYSGKWSSGGSPSFDVAADPAGCLFKDRAALNKFQAMRFVRKAVDMAISNKKERSHDIAELSDVIYRKLLLESFARDVSRSSEHLAFQKELSGEEILASILWSSVGLYETSHLKNYEKAVDILELLLRRGSLPRKRYKIHQRLAINLLVNLKLPQLALESCVRALRSDLLPRFVQKELAHKIVRSVSSLMPKRLKRVNVGGSEAAGEGSGAENPSWLWTHPILPENVRETVRALLSEKSEQFPSLTLIGNHLQKLPSEKHGLTDSSSSRANRGKNMYVDENDEIQSVESFILGWYFAHEPGDIMQSSNFADELREPSQCCLQRESLDTHRLGWAGMHDEGAVLRELFGIIMASQLLDASIPNAFVVPAQVAPLDLYTESFYARRKESVERTLERLGCLTKRDLFFEILIGSAKLYPRRLPGVTWRQLQSVLKSFSGRRWYDEFKKSAKNYYDLVHARLQPHLPSNKFQTLLQPYKAVQAPRKGDEAPGETGLSPFTKREVPEPACKGMTPLDGILFLSMIAAGIGPKPLTCVCRQLCQNYGVYKSGLPDLLLWKAPPQPDAALCGKRDIPVVEILFCEVKSVNDKLSPKQRYWLDFMHSSGLNVEVVSIRPVPPEIKWKEELEDACG